MLWDVPKLKFTLIHTQNPFFDKINFWHFSIFELWVYELWRPKFDLSGRISADRLYFRKIYTYNSFPFKMAPLIRLSYCSSLVFVIFLTFLKSEYFVWVPKSSSGWVLMDLKVLPSKSLYISHQSKIITHILIKFMRLMSFYRIYHSMCKMSIRAQAHFWYNL